MDFLVNMTIAGSVTAVLLIAVRLLLGNRLSPGWCCAIWLILAVRLLVPALPESEWSIFNVIAMPQQNMGAAAAETRLAETERSGQSSGQISHAPVTDDREIAQVRGEISEPAVGRLQAEGEMPQAVLDGIREQAVSSSGGITAGRWILAAWLGGIFLCGGWLAGTYLCFRRKIKDLPICDDGQWQALLSACKAEAGIRREIEIRSGMAAPMTAGLWKPVILVPGDSPAYSEEEKRLVLLHELMHLKYGDMLVNVAASALLCIYWYNPLYWLCFRMLRRDMESLCDQRVLNLTGERRAYAVMLMKSAQGKSRFVFAASAMQNGEREVVLRVRRIAEGRKNKLWMAGVAALVAVGAGAVCLTNAVEPEIYYGFGPGGSYMAAVPEGYTVSKGYDETGDLIFEKAGREAGGIRVLPWQEGTQLPGKAQWTGSLVSTGPGGQWFVLNGYEPQVQVRIKTAREITGLRLFDQPVRGAIAEIQKGEKEYTTHLFLVTGYPAEYGEGETDKNGALLAFDVYVESGKNAEKQVKEIAETIVSAGDPCLYRPELAAYEDWDKDIKRLLEEYFDHYASMALPQSKDIAGYRIDSIERVDPKDDGIDWNSLYPDSAVRRVTYTLTPEKEELFAGPVAFEQFGVFSETVFQNGTAGRPAVRFDGFLSDEEVLAYQEGLTEKKGLEISQLKQISSLLLSRAGSYNKEPDYRAITGYLPLAQYMSGFSVQECWEPHGSCKMTIRYRFDQEAQLPVSAGAEEQDQTAAFLEEKLWNNAAILLCLSSQLESVTFEMEADSESDPFAMRESGGVTVTREEVQREYSEPLDSYAWTARNFERYLDSM